MALTLRSYRSPDDYWRIRDFLREVTLRNDRRERSWHVARLDYWWWFVNPFLERLDLERCVSIWETDAGRIAAVVNPEGPAEAFLQVHPDLRTPALDGQLVDVAVATLAVPDADGRRRLTAYVDAEDVAMRGLLERRGFARVEEPGAWEVQHRRSLAEPLPEVPAVAGYTIRPLGDGLELLERCYASGLGFHDDDIAVARDNRDRPAWYRGIQAAPLYRRDLDVVAVAADGSIGAFCTAWFDDVTRTACLEPVATVPSHRRRGLARAVILEALHRLQRMGCLVAFVSGYSVAANGLYDAVMGPARDVSEAWELRS